MPTPMLSLMAFERSIQAACLPLWRQAAETGDGSRVGVFIRLPEDLSKKFPKNNQDASPAHVTFLYVGVVEGMEQEALLLRVLGKHLRQFKAPIKAKLDGEDFFHGVQGRVPHVRVRFNQDMDRTRRLLVEELRELGWTLADWNQAGWRPHVTLEYQEPGAEAQHFAEIPEGTWSFDTFEVWGLKSLKKIQVS